MEHGHAPVASPFSPTEWDELRRQDGIAGKMVGGLMATIFSIGVIIYGVVLFWTVSY